MERQLRFLTSPQGGEVQQRRLQLGEAGLQEHVHENFPTVINKVESAPIGERQQRDAIDSTGTVRPCPRAKWSHQMKLFIIQLLKDHDVPGFRNQNAWSKEAWTSITSQLNTKFVVSFTVNQVKQKEQDLKKDYRSVKDLLAESGFGWDSVRMMVDAPADIWATFAARKNSKDALQWRDKSFPYYDELVPLYDGRHAEGRTRRGMDYYASWANNVVISVDEQPDVYQSPSPTLQGAREYGMHFSIEEETEDFIADAAQCSSTPFQQMKSTPSSAQARTEKSSSRRAKKQKRSTVEPPEGFHERYLKLKQEEIDRFAGIEEKKASIEEKKAEDPYNINKCIITLEGLDGLQVSDILLASDIFQAKDHREVFLSFSSDELRLAWIKREITRSNTNYQC
ncbi:uncharacterized protein At2g29880 [Brachypodium distachyon]|uniref:uncharacterized protein At2g29880 n=1 Tax=Brachypodium distachyon TaxID=15368 RepID=UPI000234FB2D|nr:uncharacterized protein At2g29880 [Brachypodium distachyon]|eukprot:XP_003571386.1 uncharacterized protein At2g29880 [Brachypodium distachyon]